MLDENLNGYPSTQLTVMDKLHLGLWTMGNELNAVAIGAEWIGFSMAAISGQRRIIMLSFHCRVE